MRNENKNIGRLTGNVSDETACWRTKLFPQASIQMNKLEQYMDGRLTLKLMEYGNHQPGWQQFHFRMVL